jgi:hypothetical protein
LRPCVVGVYGPLPNCKSKLGCVMDSTEVDFETGL